MRLRSNTLLAIVALSTAVAAGVTKSSDNKLALTQRKDCYNTCRPLETRLRCSDEWRDAYYNCIELGCRENAPHDEFKICLPCAHKDHPCNAIRTDCGGTFGYLDLKDCMDSGCIKISDDIWRECRYGEKYPGPGFIPGGPRGG